MTSLDTLRLVVLRALVAALLALPITCQAVLAEDILRLEGPVTDTTGELAGAEPHLTDVIARTLDTRGIQVYVVFIRTTGDLTAADYVTETARRNSLGVNDAIVLVALDDRTDQIWVSDGLDEITDDELDTIIAGTLEPGLRDGNFGGAIGRTIEALGEAAVEVAPPTTPPSTRPASPPPSQGGGGAGDEDDGSILGTFVALAILTLGAAVLWQAWRRRSPGQPATSPGQEPAPDPAALAREANALLIATDERIRDAAQETDFAEAQFGAEAVTSFRAAVAQARDELGAAFTVRQRLDDATPEDEPTRIAMLREIIERTTRAQERLDAETERIRELHDLQRDAPNTIVALPGQIEAVEDRLDATAATMARLQRYADAVWASVAGNLEEARKGLAGARTAVTEGSEAAAGDDRAAVAVATRTAMEGLTGAAVLLDAIDRLAADITEAERRVPVELEEATRDLEDARQAIVAGSAGPAGAAIRSAEATLERAQAAANAEPPDPLEALRFATEAHRQADEALVAARDAAEAADRLRVAAESSVRTAAVEVDRAERYVAARRRGVGETARTRLAEAARHLATASDLLATDAERALGEARRAQSLAQEAYRLAQDDFSDWDQGGPGWGQRRGRSGDETTAILGHILGGVIGGVLSGGSRGGGGGGWGGSPWGGGGGFGRSSGGGWGGGGFGSGGFGGGGGGRGRSRGGGW